jgi:chromosome segregation ATPase
MPGASIQQSKGHKVDEEQLQEYEEELRRRQKELHRREKEEEARQEEIESSEAWQCQEAERLRALQDEVNALRRKRDEAEHRLPQLREELEAAREDAAEAEAEYEYGDGTKKAMKKARKKVKSLEKEVRKLSDHGLSVIERALRQKRRALAEARDAAEEKAEELRQPYVKAVAEKLQEAIAAQEDLEKVEEAIYEAGLSRQSSGAKDPTAGVSKLTGVDERPSSIEKFVADVLDDE